MDYRINETQKRINWKKIFWVTILFLDIATVIGIFGVYKWMHTPAIKVSAQQLTCQYPARSTNPPGGCDNSDPCDSSNAAHGGSGDCAPSDQKIIINGPEFSGPYREMRMK